MHRHVVRRPLPARAGALLAAILTLLTSLRPAPAFTAFESGPVRPLALSSDGSRLYACNTPDNRLEVFAVDSAGLTHLASVPVGLEPVAVALRDTQAWVVNHLSDSISVVDVSVSPPVVRHTLLVGDEPRDIVFAGPGRRWAFVTTAYRGQNAPFDPQLTTAGVGRAALWVFDVDDPGSAPGGTPRTVIRLFGDTPRALAASPDGQTIYAAVFHSGNRTTAISDGVVCDGGAGAGPCVVAGVTYPGGLPAPNTNVHGVRGPETGLIVKFDGTRWIDTIGRDWSNAVRFNLPDRDVFVIDASGGPAPTPVTGPGGFVTGVGTILYNMVANPVSGKLYVSNTDANNLTRFEGPGGGGSTVQGHLHEARITVIDGSSVLPRRLNKHLDYSIRPAPPGAKDHSLATPLEMAVTSDGSTLYVAAFGSGRVGVFSTAELEADTFVPDSASHIPVSGGGPAGLVLDEARKRLYVYTRFDNGISVVDTTTRTEIDKVLLHNPEPPSIVNGRRFLYDAFHTSSNGEASCAACHVFGDLDSLAWDLGNPDDAVLPNPNPFRLGPVGSADFHPLKGPMATQSLRGMAGHGPMHWRGDRTGGHDPGGNPLDEAAAFRKFNAAFKDLLGRTAPLTDAEMQAFTDFMLQVTYPPNPIRNLDNSLTSSQQTGRTFYFTHPTDGGIFTCNHCHVLDPAAGFFGSDGFSSFENEPQHFKVPHLRNLYQKVGMFGMPAIPFIGPGSGSTAHQGDQIRGVGFLHDGSIDTILRFLNATVFSFPGGNAQRRAVEDFLLAFDSNLAPIVGQQITLSASNPTAVGPRIDLLVQRAAAGECDLVVKGNLAGKQRGWVRTVAGTFQSDRATDLPVPDAALRAHAAVPLQERTYLCVPPGSGTRIGIDRDDDTYFDRDELDVGSDPADPGSVPPPAACVNGRRLENVRLGVRGNALPAGDEALKLTAALTISPASNPALAGIVFSVRDTTATTVFELTVPGGAGWTTSPSRKRWTFRDPAGSLTGSPLTVTIRDRSGRGRPPGTYAVSIRAPLGEFRIPPDRLPVRTVVRFGPGPGQCASAVFDDSGGPGGPSPSCTVTRGGTSVNCS